jgi:hypothetical protein
MFGKGTRIRKKKKEDVPPAIIPPGNNSKRDSGTNFFINQNEADWSEKKIIPS